MANNAKIKAAGIDPGRSRRYGDTWTSQLFVLADYYNVQPADARTSPRSTPHNKVKYADTPAGARGLPAPRRRLREGLVPEQGLRVGQVRRRRSSMLAAGQGRALPDARRSRCRTIATNDPGQAQRHRLLRPAGRRRRQERRDDLDAGRRSTSRRRPRAPSSTRPRSSSPSSPRPRAARRRAQGVRADRPVRGQGLPRCRTTCLPAIKDIQPYIDDGNVTPGARVPVAGQGPGARADHRRGRLRACATAAGRRRRCTTRTSKKQAKQLGLAGLVEPQRETSRAGRSARAAPTPRREETVGMSIGRRDAAAPARARERRGRGGDGARARTRTGSTCRRRGLLRLLRGPDVRVVLLQPDPLDAVRLEFIGLDNFAQFFQEPALTSGLTQHAHLRRRHHRARRSSSGCCWRCC